MNNGKTAVPSGQSCLHFILTSINEWAGQAFFFSFFSSCHRDACWTAYAFAHT